MDEQLQNDYIELHFERSVSGGDGAASDESIPYSYSICIEADPEELALLQDINNLLHASSISDGDVQSDRLIELQEQNLAALKDQNDIIFNGFIGLDILLGLIIGCLIALGLWLGGKH